MYKNILIPVDNSRCSNQAIDLGISLAKLSGASLTGSHVYSARLHDKRFKDMEEGLPEPYLKPDRLEHSRVVHDSLIGEGLKLISGAYLDVFEKKCSENGLTPHRKLQEGKNWFEIVKDSRASAYDLIIMGAQGLGAVDDFTLGSVTERVIRSIETDLLVIKDSRPVKGLITVAVDGSNYSRSALKRSLELAKLYDTELEAVSVFDPNYHTVAFQSLVGVLSEEQGEKFKFEEQEKLHDEVIDKGLQKVYQGYLQEAEAIAAKSDIKIKTTLLAGKPWDEICKHVSLSAPSLLILSRFGAHQAEELILGSNAEHILYKADCNILLT